MTSTRQPRVFVSYAQRDQDFVRRLTDALKQILPDVEFYQAVESLQAGGDLFNEIALAIERSDALILVLSPDSRNSSWVNAELAWALSRKHNIPILPVLRTDPAYLPPLVKNTIYADFREESSFPSQIQFLGNSLLRALNNKSGPSGDAGVAAEFIEIEQAQLLEKVAAEREKAERSTKILQIFVGFTLAAGLTGGLAVFSVAAGDLAEWLRVGATVGTAVAGALAGYFSKAAVDAGVLSRSRRRG